MGKSSIEWTGSTWNPIRARNLDTGQVGTHCVKISPGCANCYAAAHNHRNLPRGCSGLPYTAAGAVRAEYFIDPEILAEPLRRKKPETYFVCSMTDIFMYPPEMVAALFGVMAACPQHTFQVLTKRPETALASFYTRGLLGFEEDVAAHASAHGVLWDGRGSEPWRYPSGPTTHRLKDRRAWVWPLANAWIGVSVEDCRHGLPRIDVLRQIPAALRFLSIEPLLEDLGEIDLTGIGWVIVGGESGRDARPMHPAWVRSIRDQCVVAGAPFFFKQWGQYGSGCILTTTGTAAPPREFTNFQHWVNKGDTWVRGGVCLDTQGRILRRGADMQRARDEGAFPVAVLFSEGKRRAGRLLDGREWSEMPRTASGPR